MLWIEYRIKLTSNQSESFSTTNLFNFSILISALSVMGMKDTQTTDIYRWGTPSLRTSTRGFSIISSRWEPFASAAVDGSTCWGFGARILQSWSLVCGVFIRACWFDIFEDWMQKGAGIVVEVYFRRNLFLFSKRQRSLLLKYLQLIFVCLGNIHTPYFKNILFQLDKICPRLSIMFTNSRRKKFRFS